MPTVITVTNDNQVVRLFMSEGPLLSVAITYYTSYICFILSIYQLKERQQHPFLQKSSGDEVSG